MQRDMLCVSVDGLMCSAFTPSIMSDQYSVRFIPVVMASAATAKDCFVLELRLKKSEYPQIYTLKEKDTEGFRYNRYVHCLSALLGSPWIDLSLLGMCPY